MQQWDTSAFDCNGLHLAGIEILGASLVYLVFVALFCMTFIDVALSQAWPEKFLNPVVHRRVQNLRAHFPKITRTAGKKVTDEVRAAEEKKTIAATPKRSSSIRGRSNSQRTATKGGAAAQPLLLSKAEEHDHAVVKATLESLDYDAVVSTEAYSATCCVDEDLTYVLANGDAFSTVSEYCASTVRGYTLLSTFLAMTSTVLGFLWIHNARLHEVGNNYWRYTGLVGYFFCFLTAMFMIPPNPNTVFRNRNIVLWDSVKTSNPILGWHSTGMLVFCFLPLLGNFGQLVTLPEEALPNRPAMWAGFFSQIAGTAVFFVSHLANIPGFLDEKSQPLKRKHVSIFAELVMIVSSMTSFLQIETFSTAACIQMPYYGAAIVGTMMVIFSGAFARHYHGAPVGSYSNGPSVLLLNKGQPVATSGPVPVLNYNRIAVDLPNVEPVKLKKWLE